jgi:hypothetical protein
MLGLPAIASAQYGQYDPYGRNGGYNNGGYNNGDQRSVIRNLKQNARQFTRQLDRDLDHSRYDGSRREDQINTLADRFRDAVNNLNNNGYYDSRRGTYGGNNEMRRVYDLAGQIERQIGRANVSYNTRNLWGAIRNDLQSLSGGYYDNGRNNRRSGGWGNTNRSGLPSWWPF